MYFIFPERYIWGIEQYRIVLILNVILIIIVFMTHRRLVLFDERYSILMACLTGSFFLSAILAQVDSRFALDGAFLFAKGFAFWIILKNILNHNHQNLDKFLWISLASLSLLALWGIQQYLLGNIRLENFGGPQISGSNQIASAFVWAVPIAYYKFIHDTGRKKAISAICLSVLLAAIVCTQSRQAFLAVVFYVVALFLTSRKKMLFVSLVVLIGLLALPLIPTGYWQRMQTIGEYQEEASAAGRLDTWSTALRIFSDYPMFGVGSDNFTLIAPRYARPGQIIRVTHNTYFQILTEEGLVGLTFFILLVISAMLGLYRCYRKYRSEDDPIAWHALAMGMSLAGVLVCCIFQNKADHEFLYWPIAVAAALETISRSRSLQNNQAMKISMTETTP